MLCSAGLYAQSQFTDVTEESGIDHYFQVFQGTFGGGAAVLDFNNDGHEDVFIAGGSGKNALYKNNGDGTFTNVIDEAGFTDLDTVVTQGAVCADVNKDGYTDIFITTIASVNHDRFTAAANFLFINEGNGTFINKTKSFGLNDITFSTGAAFGDVNLDGFPDLFVGNYFDKFKGRLDDYSGVLTEGEQAPAADLLYINNQGGSFIEAGQLYGMDHTGLGFGGVFTDYDNDGDLDLMVINDFGNRATPNLLYRNEYPEKAFTEVGTAMGFDFAINAMGVGIGDYNLDGWLDYFISNISSSPFLENQGQANLPFLEKTKQLGTSHPTLYTKEGQGVPAISWGAIFFDDDNDMDLDLYVANGCLNPSILPNPNLFLENINGQFVLNGPSSGLSDPSIGRGSVTFDYDNDGDLDLLVVNQSQYRDPGYVVETQGVRLFRNEAVGNNWLKVKLLGQTADKHGIGSRVEVYVNGKKLIREIDGGSSHESQNSSLAHFGLANATQVDSLVVRWMPGAVQTLYEVAANQLIIADQAIVTGLEEPLPLLSVMLYPNPTNSYLKIRTESLQHVEAAYLEVYHLNGQLIDQYKMNREDITDKTILWKVPHALPPGVYILKVSIGTEVVLRRFIKE